jgi:hypothetical protein
MRHVLRVVGIVLMLAALLGPAAGWEAGAQTAGGRFAVSARADGMGIETTATGLPLVPGGKAAFVTPGTAQALLSSFGSFGESSAFASAPYPGEFLISLPTTINGLGSGVLPPIPSFPFYVAADGTQPERAEEVGPYRIAATAGATSAAAETRLGLATTTPAIGSITAHATVSQAAGSGVLTAESASVVAPFAVSDLLRIGEVRTSVRLIYDPAKPEAGVHKETSTAIGTIRIAGVELSLTPDGLVLAGQKLLPIDLTGLTGLLAPLGLSLEYVPSTETDTGITSAAVQLTYRGEIPNLGATTIRYVLGQVSASVTTPPEARPRTAAPAPTPPPASSSGSGSSPAPAAAPAAPRPPPGSAAPAPSPAATGGTPIASEPLPLTDPSVFYLALVGAALAAIGSSRLSTWAGSWRRPLRTLGR